jgi:hypothetical protein
MGNARDLQDLIAAVLLRELGPVGFALAGSGAIREYGLTDRPTRDVDLFGAATLDAPTFEASVSRGCRVLQEAGLTVSIVTESSSFARLIVTADSGTSVEVDLAINWRAEPPIERRLGLVLSVRDAVAGKLSAVYNRGEVRDFLDLDSIRQSGRFTDTRLLEIGREDDPGFESVLFSDQLSRITQFGAHEARRYGVVQGDFEAVRERTLAWAKRLRDEASP